MQFDRVCVIGLGYIGLPTATVLATGGVSVLGVDVDAERIAKVNKGELPIVEPGLDEVLACVVSKGLLRAAGAAEAANAFVIAVPTPFIDEEHHEPDLRFVESACRTIAPVLAQGNLVILESTSPVGTTEKVADWLAALRPDLTFPHQAGESSDIRVAYCPERVLPGKILEELVSNDRIVGGMTPACAAAAVALYALFVKGECIVTNARAAELCKLSENSFRDVNIAFANELSLICDHLGIADWEVIALANRHPRVNILQPGPGVGGHCIAVDPWFIVSSAPDQARLVRTAREVNDSKPHWVVGKVGEAIAALRAARPKPIVACLGLAFKADIDDLRESPARAICKALASRDDCRTIAVEPNIQTLPADLVGKTELMGLWDALALADIIVVLVDHMPFKSITLADIDGKTLIDTRGLFRAAA